MAPRQTSWLHVSRNWCDVGSFTCFCSDRFIDSNADHPIIFTDSAFESAKCRLYVSKASAERLKLRSREGDCSRNRATGLWRPGGDSASIRLLHSREIRLKASKLASTRGSTTPKEAASQGICLFGRHLTIFSEGLALAYGYFGKPGPNLLVLFPGPDNLFT